MDLPLTPMSSLSTSHLNYLQRIGTSALPLPENPQPLPLSVRQAFRVEGSGRAWDRSMPITVGAGTNSLLAGLWHERVPVAFFLSGRSVITNVYFGTWIDPAIEEKSLLDTQTTVIQSVLDSAYTGLRVSAGPTVFKAQALNGLVLGVPTLVPPDASSGTQVDRLVRGMSGGTWSVAILAEPVAEDFIADLRQDAVNEMRSAQAASVASGTPSPLASQYTDLLELAVSSLSVGLSVGAWRCGVYLSGDFESYYRLSATWKAIFTGKESRVEPLRVWTDPSVAAAAQGWSLPYMPEDDGPGLLKHPFKFQTLLSSAQLSAYIHLPQQETTGFQVTDLGDFDVVVPAAGVGPSAEIGTVVQRNRPTDSAYKTQLATLTRHVLVAGVTGSGKTTTVKHLLDQVASASVPFLVVEPAKQEYRSLLHETSIGSELTVYTLGDEATSPLRLNPFEVPPGVSVAEHLDLLRSAFSASSGMWTPLPQVLERCLHRIYSDRGFDLATGRNRRLAPDDDAFLAFPTLTELSDTIRRTVPTLGYDERVASDILAALLTRIDSLRIGAKGLMLDRRESADFESLLENSAVLELERIADDDDKAFLMSLFLIRLVEHRRAEQRRGVHSGQGQLRHLLVVEEAHRLFTAVQGPRRQEEADPRGKAVETFANLLAELRAYGQGVLVADQIPTRLAPDVIKNTSLKIAHRIVAADDRTELAGAMALTDLQTRALTSLPVGQAVVFGEQDDSGILVMVPKRSSEAAISQQDLVAKITSRRFSKLGARGMRPYDDCNEDCAADAEICGEARRLSEIAPVRRAVARLILSAVDNASSLKRLLPELSSVVIPRISVPLTAEEVIPSLLVHSLARLADRRGDQAGWTYGQTSLFAEAVCRLALDGWYQRDLSASHAAYSNLFHNLTVQVSAPYPSCVLICGSSPSSCYFRHDVADLINSGEQNRAWHQSDVDDALKGGGRRERSWQVALDAAYSLIEFPERDWPSELQESVAEAARRTALCFVHQMLDRDPLKSPRTNGRIMDRIFREAAE